MRQPLATDQPGSGKGKGASKSMPGPVSWAEKVRLAQAKAQSLEQVAALARKVGSETARDLAREAEEARKKATGEKPLYARLQRMEERETAATQKLSLAEAELAQAQRRADQAESHLQAVRREKESLQQEMSEERLEGQEGPAADVLVPAVRELLARLEGPAATSEDLEEVVGRLHMALESAWPTPAGKLDVPLVDELRPGQASAARGEKRQLSSAQDADFESGDEGPGEMQEAPRNNFRTQLVAAPEKSDAEVGAMARKALARPSPY